MKPIGKAGMRAIFDAEVIRGPFHLFEEFAVSSIWEVEHWRKGKLIDHSIHKNICVYEGLDYLLDVPFSAGTAITSWYVALFEDNHSPSMGDTYATPGYTECTAYDEANRPGWQEAGVSSQTITNSANKASFTMNATKTIYGGALVGGGSAPSTKGDTAGGGTLYAESQWQSGSKPVIDDDVLKIAITLQSQDI